MIEYRTGDILKSKTEALVNTVNCVGIMGRGIALQFKEIFPDNFKSYHAACLRSEVRPGSMFVFETKALTNPKYIINFPTKRHWRGKSRMEDIESGLIDLVEIIRRYHIRSISIPPLGSGLGGLDWNDVRSRIENSLCDLNEVEVLIYQTDKAFNSQKINKCYLVPKMTSGRAALVVLMYRYLSGLMDPFITLLEVHKLLYFMQEAGQPLKLNYKKGPYGPYAENLRHVLNAIEGHLVSGYSGSDVPDNQLQLVQGAVENAERFLKCEEDSYQRFKRVSDLVEGFETPFGLELLATVHWVVIQEKASNKQEAVTNIHRWNKRKKCFSPRQIGVAFDLLQEKHWL